MPEIIVDRRPASRGVTQLTYVGDDGETAIPSNHRMVQLAAVTGLVALAVMSKGSHRTVAIAAAGLVAATTLARW